MGVPVIGCPHCPSLAADDGPAVDAVAGNRGRTSPEPSLWLNYHHLLYFWTVVQEGGVSKAAGKLRLSQPTISAQVRLLEDCSASGCSSDRAERWC